MAYYQTVSKNKYYTLYSDIRDDILRGKLAAGEKLPSKRALAADLGVSVVTVQLAYEQLLAEGYIFSRERSGYYVEKVAVQPPKPRRGAAENPPSRGEAEEFAADFVKGAAPAELFPFSTWAKLTRTVLTDSGEHLLERVPCDGDPELKREIAEYLYRSRGIDCDPRYVVIGAGAEYLYGVVVQLLGRGLYAVENPGYANIASAYLQSGASVAPVPVIGAGICLNELKKVPALALHISPAHQFPTGVVTHAGLRFDLIGWAQSFGGYIIEDDYDSEFRLAGKPLQSLYGVCPERVVYMNTFSKTLAPSMRLGYMILPPALYEKFMKIFASSANVVPLFEQKTLAAMLKGGYFERHINRLRNNYRGVRRILSEKLAALGKVKIFDTGGGPHMLCGLGLPDARIKEAAQKSNIGLKCLADYLIAPREGLGGYAVLNYSGLTSERAQNVDFAEFGRLIGL